MPKRRRINWIVSDIARKTRKTWLELSAKLRGQRFYCSALSGQSEYNLTINCDGTLTCNCHDYNGSGNLGDLKDEKGFHRPEDVERPAGQWNVLECICQADKILVRLNGKVVNAASGVSPRKGKIGLLSEKSEIFFRTINLQAIAPK